MKYSSIRRKRFLSWREWRGIYSHAIRIKKLHSRRAYSGDRSWQYFLLGRY